MRVEEEKFRIPVDVRGSKTSELKLSKHCSNCYAELLLAVLHGAVLCCALVYCVLQSSACVVQYVVVLCLVVFPSTDSTFRMTGSFHIGYLTSSSSYISRSILDMP